MLSLSSSLRPSVFDAYKTNQPIYTVSQKTSHLCLAITFTHVNGFWYFFGRNVTDKVNNQKTLYYATSITCASVLPGKMGNTKITFFTRCISAFSEFSQLLLDFFNLFDPRLIYTLLYDSISLVTNAFSSGLLWGTTWFRRKEVESAAAVGLCCMHKAPVHCLLGFLFRRVMLKH